MFSTDNLQAGDKVVVVISDTFSGIGKYIGTVIKKTPSEQVYSERLYKVREELKALFLLPGAIPVISEKGSREKQRYAKLTSYSSEIRLSEKSLYTKIGLDFTEDTKQEKEYELIQEIDLEMNTRKN